MKKLILMLIAAAMLITACNPAPKEEAEQGPLILASIYPYELMIKELVGDGARVRSLIPPNASVHTYSPQPSDLKDLNKADLIIVNGMGLEAMIEQRLRTLKEKTIVVSDLLGDLIALDSLEQIREHQLHHHDDDDHHHAGADPHLWTSVSMMQRLNMKLKSILAERFSDLAPLVNHNYEALARSLDEAHLQISQERKGLDSPALVTYHNSFHYFTREYDIDYLGWVQSSPGKEPTARQLSRLGEKIQSHKVKSIFIEPQQNPKSAEILAKEYKLDIHTLDPIGHSFQPKGIAELLLRNWQEMKKAFSPITAPQDED